MGSLIVLAGCTFYGFGSINYEGDIYQYNGALTVANNQDPVLGIYANEICGQVVEGYRSIQCRCQQAFIACAPTDDYVPVMSCDATNSEISVECTYTETIGTTYTEEAMQSMSVSATVEESIQLGLFDLFSSDLGFSATTQYNWSTSAMSTFESIQTYEVKVDVPPGYMVSL